MNKKILLILAFLLTVCGNCLMAQEPERILNWHSDISVQKDGSMLVNETIKVSCVGSQIKHGIYRDFPTKYKDIYGNTYKVDFKLIGVYKNGISEPYHFGNKINGIRIYIGRKDVLLVPGEYTYEIKYYTNRQLGFFKDKDELYWNVTGNGWFFPIDEASATVVLPEGASKSIIEIDGFTGPQGSRNKYFSKDMDPSGKINFIITRPLKSYEGFTILLSWQKGFVKEPALKEKIIYVLRDNKNLFLGIIGFVVIFFYYFVAWAKVGKDPEKGIIIPIYSPPDNISPQAMRFVMKMGYDNKAFAAMLINLAVKGILRIENENGAYSIIRTGKNEELLDKTEQNILGSLVSGTGKIDLKNTNHEIIRNSIEILKKSLQTNYEKHHFVTNVNFFIPGAIFSAVFIAASVFTGDADRSSLAIFMSIWLTIWTFGVAALLTQVVSLWKGVLYGTGIGRLYSSGAAIFLTLFSIPFIAGEVFGTFAFINATSAPIFLILILMVSLNIIFYYLLKAPTVLGRKLMDKIEGFKMYLSVAEKDRLNFIIQPEKKPEIFEKYLPYALALGVEQKWAEYFADVFSTATVGGNQYSPAWYSGTAWAASGLPIFASSFASSFTSAISSSSTAPGSSSGGGGGGGSGGGGGGGGGGW
ncbi:MAG: DUF2207 domain-containing protein [Elusimicrobia bacterium]|nr:DUF2207 domain-containing protein [Elusimicrobiota bacterium]